MDSKKTAIIVVLVVVVVILFAVLASGFLSQSQQTLQVDDLNIKQDEFGIYKLQESCALHVSTWGLSKLISCKIYLCK